MAEDKSKKTDDITLSDIDELYKEDIDLINDEMAAMQELYNEMKVYYDNVKNKTKTQAGSGAYNFLMQQSETLVKLKEVKMKMAKERVNTKKIMMDTKLSIIRSRKDSGGEEYAMEVAKQMYDMIMNGKNDMPELKNPTNFSHLVANEEEADRLLAKKLGLELDEDIDYEAELEEMETISEEEIIEEEEIPEGIRFICNMQGTVIAVDEDYNEVTSIPIPEAYSKIVFSLNDDDEYVAFNLEGEEVEIAEF